MPTAFTMVRPAYEWLRHEIDQEFTREVVTIAFGAGDLPSGMVLGKITASGKFVPYNPTAVDGSQAAVAILLDATNATSADKKAIVIKGFAVVARAELQWHASVDTELKKTTALGQLSAKFFEVRNVA